MRSHAKLLFVSAGALTLACFGVSAAQAPGYRTVVGAHTLNPGDWPAHYPFADETEATVAASEVHHVRYIDAHVRFVEVAYFPGVQGNMHGHPYPSVFAVDAPVPKATNTPFDPARNMVSVLSPPPEGAVYPICRAASPQGLHHETNQDSFPHHFYRLEFMRLDGPDLKDHWKQWYPRALDAPVVVSPKPARGGPKLSAQWPYPKALDSYRAAPDSNRLLYEDDHVRLVEILVRPGVTEALHGDPYPSVLAFDTAGGPSPAEFGPGGRESPPLKGFESLKCATTGPHAPYATRNAGDTPIHFYRIEFKRIDGEGIKDHWREWYPWMATLKDEYDRSPYAANF